MRSTQRSILITGCSSGIGLHAASYLKDKGFHVLPTARKAEDLHALTKLGFDAIELNVNEQSSIEACVASVLEKTNGKLFGLINNAGFVQPGALAHLSREVLESQFATNVFGLHALTQAFMPTFLTQKQGRIIHVSSVLGFVPKAFLGAYNASKYAVEGLGDTLRLELAHHKDLHVVLVQPGPIQSKLFSNAVTIIKDRLNKHKKNADYQLLETMQKDSKDHWFKKGPEATSKVFYQALTAKHPKSRYRITLPCHAAAWGKRLLPADWLDKMMLMADKDTPKLTHKSTHQAEALALAK